MKYRLAPRNYDLEPLDESKEYTSRELEMYADVILYEDRLATGGKANGGEYYGILDDSQLEGRRAREIFLESGTADSSLHESAYGQGIFNRVNSEGKHTRRNRLKKDK